MDDETEKDAAETLGKQDAFRRICLGQVSDPLIPPPSESSEAPEDELTKMALEDPMAFEPATPSGPTLWRVIILLAFAVLALGTVFWWR